MSDTLVYAARVKDRKLLVKSSSGGAFTALSDVILSDGNAIACGIYNYETKQVEFQLITDRETRDTARGSKYMQSVPGNIFKKAVAWLKANPERSFLFIGMGCQTAGFRKFAEISGFRNRVTLVDIICHGSPSPMLWQEYAEHLEEKHGEIEYLTFKDKRNGWKHPIAVAITDKVEIPLNDYVKVFYSCCALRPACHKCPYTTINRNTDITIGDYWGIDKVMPDFFDEKGVSMILVHSDKGKELFDRSKEFLEYRESNTTECLQPNLIHPTVKSEMREKFWQDYHWHGMKYIMNNYGSATIQGKIKNKLKKVTGGGIAH